MAVTPSPHASSTLEFRTCDLHWNFITFRCNLTVLENENPILILQQCERKCWICPNPNLARGKFMWMCTPQNKHLHHDDTDAITCNSNKNLKITETGSYHLCCSHNDPLDWQLHDKSPSILTLAMVLFIVTTIQNRCLKLQYAMLKPILSRTKGQWHTARLCTYCSYALLWNTTFLEHRGETLQLTVS